MIVNELIAGDTLDFVTTVEDYSAADGWTLTHVLRGPSAIDLTATAMGRDYRTVVVSAITATWLPGDYTYREIVIKPDGQRYTVGGGTLRILPDLAQAAAGYDGRTQAEKALDDARSAMATFMATQGAVKRYTIGMRSMEFQTAAEIIPIIRYWELKVANERTKTSIASGLGNPRKLKIRFAR